jgi:predicted NAD/FAD-dependent oxidoreductase
MTPSAEKNACDVLVIGGGIAGLTAARDLRTAGKNAIVLEKSRGFGGRAATRRWDGMPVDHGAQFFTARSPEFRAQVEDWLQRGVCFEWSRGFYRATEHGPKPPDGDNFPRYACREGMASLGRDLAGHDPSFVLRGAKATTVQSRDSIWEVCTEDGCIFSSRALIMTPPPPQSAGLLADISPDASALLQSLPMAPCLALAARYPRTEFPWCGIQSPTNPVISWIGQDTSKRPDLHPEATVLVLHAAPDFSAANFDADEHLIARQMLETAGQLTRADLSAPQSWFLQRWRYALGAETAGEAARLLPGMPPLVLAGDAIAGGKIEGAWRSGREAACLAVSAL